MLLPAEHEKMTPVQLALEVALYVLVTQDNLHVTDVPDVAYTWNIDNSEAIKLIKKVLEENFT